MTQPSSATLWSATPEELRASKFLYSFWNKPAVFLARVQNKLVDLFSSSESASSESPEMNEILAHAKARTDISDHLPTLFVQALEFKPRLIVELGVRGGESTFVFERVAKLTEAKLVSVDIENCSRVSQLPGWIFVQIDDLKFAKEFKLWSREKGVPSEIDVLFIDTSHFFQHTVLEIASWLPLLAPRAKVIFHDTNQRKFYFRKDGSMGIGWNCRGVISALEKYFGKSFNEKRDFTDSVKGWQITHHANCSGLTILTRAGAKS